MIEFDLQELGLSKRESSCYSALLGLGSSTVGAICDESNIPSSKIYEVLERLIQKGLVTYVVKGKIKHYSASDPKVLLESLDEKRKKIMEILPKLMLKQKSGKKLSAEVYEGQKALFGLFTDLINGAKKGEKYFVFSNFKEGRSEAYTLFLRNMTLRREEKKIDVRVLKSIKEYRKEKHSKLALRYTDLNLPQGLTIFRNFVIFVSWDESPIAVKIESEQFANQFRDFFLELWAAAKK